MKWKAHPSISISNINNFIQNQTKQFSDEEVKEIIISLGKIPKQTS